MNLSIDDICRSYLRRAIPLESLRDWLALYQWDLSKYDTDLADDLDVVLVHFDDSYIDEISLRTHIAESLERRSVQYVSLDFSSQEPIHIAGSDRPSTTSTETLDVVLVVA